MAAQDYYGVVQELYVAYFGRPADHYGLLNFAAQLDSMGAPKDFATLNAQVQADKTGKTALGALVNTFNNSTESASLYGKVDATSDQSIAKFVLAIYQNVLGRAPDNDGFNFWTGEIKAGRLSPAYAASAIASGAMSNTTAQGLLDAATVTNKLAVAGNFTTALDTPVEWTAFSGDAAAASARNLLAAVNNATSVTAYQTQVDSTISSLVAAGQVGTTFALTTGVDGVAGTALNDTITGINTTVTGLDVINGGAGNDKIVLSDTDGTLKLNLLTVSNVESLEFTSAAGVQGGVADVSTWTGLTSAKFVLQNIGTTDTTVSLGDTAAGTVTVGAGNANLTVNGGTTVSVTQGNAAFDNSGKTITVNGGAATTAVTVDQSTTGAGKTAAVLIADKNYSGSTANTITTVSLHNLGDAAATINSKALSTLTVSDSDQSVTINNSTAKHTVTLNLDNVTGGTLQDSAATTVNVVTTGKATSGITLDAAAATAIKFDGSATVSTALASQAANLAITSTNSAGVTIGSTLSSTTTFAGGAGADTVTLGATAGAVTMGAGNDTVNITVALGSKGSIDGGTGTDTLAFAAADATTLSSTDTFGKQITGFEKVSLGAVAATTTATVNMANLGNINYVVAAGTGAAGTTEVDTVTFGALTTGQSITINGVTVTATGSATAAQVAAAFANPSVATNVTVSGTYGTDWAAGAVSGSTVAYTSSLNGNVTNLAPTTAGVAPGAAPAIVETNGVAATSDETAAVTFSAMTNGQKVTVGDVTLTATAAMTASDVAAAFANAAPQNGTNYTKSAATAPTGWTASAASGSSVTFTSTTAQTDVTDLTASANGTAAPASTVASVAETTAGIAGSALNLTGFAANGTLELTGVISGTSSVTLADASGSADVFNLKLNGNLNLANTGIVTVANVETVNITTAHSSTTTDVTAASTLKLNAAAATTVTVSGDHGVDFTGSTLTKLTTLNAAGVTAVAAHGATAAQIGAAGAVTLGSGAYATGSALTISTGNGFDSINLSANTKGATVSTGAGDDTITGTSGADTINAGAGRDTVTSTAGGDTITLGDGNDVFVLANATHSTIDKFATITDFVANTVVQSSTDNTANTTVSKLNGDVINLTLSGGATNIKVFVASNASDATTFLSNTAAAAGNTDGIALDKSTGLLYIDLDHNGVAESVIKLTGVTTLTEAAFHLVTA